MNKQTNKPTNKQTTTKTNTNKKNRQMNKSIDKIKIKIKMLDQVVMCNPGNPSGAVMPKDQVDRIMTMCR